MPRLAPNITLSSQWLFILRENNSFFFSDSDGSPNEAPKELYPTSTEAKLIEIK